MTPAPLRDFGNHLADLRRRRGLTQVQLAQRLGLKGNAFISRLEREHAFPSDRLLKRLARALETEESLLRLGVEAATASRSPPGFVQLLGEDVDRAREGLKARLDLLMSNLDAYQEQVSSVLHAGRMNLVWGRAQKLAFEATATDVWVVSPELSTELGWPELLQTVRGRLAAGASYRYLIPRQRVPMGRARKLQAALGRQRGLEIRTASPELFAFAVELVLYNPTDASRRLGLMVAPTRQPEFDLVLGPHLLQRFARAAERSWRTGALFQNGNG
jgi:transcriptional regulator with XRE-family HTH domain